MSKPTIGDYVAFCSKCKWLGWVEETIGGEPGYEPGDFADPRCPECEKRGEPSDIDEPEWPEVVQLCQSQAAELSRLRGELEESESDLAVMTHHYEKTLRNNQHLEAELERVKRERAGQPIEKAPRDGSEFLGFNFKRNRYGVTSAFDREDGTIWRFNGTSAHENIMPELKPDIWWPLPPASQPLPKERDDG